MEFNFTNEEIIFTYKHFTDYLDMIENRLLKELKYSEGQLELDARIYGDDPSFNKEAHDLQLQLIKEEMPKVINERIAFINNIRNKFENAYDTILDGDTLFVDDIQDKYFGDPSTITDLLNKIKDKQHGNDKD